MATTISPITSGLTPFLKFFLHSVAPLWFYCSSVWTPWHGNGLLDYAYDTQHYYLIKFLYPTLSFAFSLGTQKKKKKKKFLLTTDSKITLTNMQAMGHHHYQPSTATSAIASPSKAMAPVATYSGHLNHRAHSFKCNTACNNANNNDS